MEIKIDLISKVRIAEIVSEKCLVNEVQDALDIMAECNYNDSRDIILHEKNLTPGFFDLKTGIAGEILQKFSTYNVRLAIVGDYAKYSSKSLKDFISESNRYGRINFVSSVEEAKERLTKQSEIF